MSTPEQLATDQVRLRASELKSRVFRNNAGGCRDPQSGRMINFGLGNDGSKASKVLKFGDYIGFTPVLITPDMVGKTLAVFTNLEIKPDGDMNKTLQAASREGSREYYQWNTCEMVKAAGGFAGFVTNGKDVENVINAQNITRT